MIVIGNPNQVIFERTVGFRDVAEGDPLRPDAIWRIYSMTKPIVTAAAMVLVEAGLLCCDQPVAEFIPLFARLTELGILLVRGVSIEEIARVLRRDNREVRVKVAEVGRACRASAGPTVL